MPISKQRNLTGEPDIGLIAETVDRSVVCLSEDGPNAVKYDRSVTCLLALVWVHTATDTYIFPGQRHTTVDPV